MGYQIEPGHDRAYIEEFRSNPVGHHSPGLQRLLNSLRFDPSGWQTVLVCRKPFAEWVIGRMPPRRQDPMEIEDDPIFTSRAAAEWAVFCRRWQAATGEAINLPPPGQDD